MSKISLFGAALVACLNSTAQYGDLGIDTQPLPSEEIAPLIYYGEVHDFSGGYHVADTVMNFTVYDKNGMSVTLYDELAGEKPVVLVSGSVSCNRFRDVFDVNAEGPYLDVKNNIGQLKEAFNWIFIYGVEAHPTDGNCPSNCPPTITTDTTVFQHPDYNYRLWALQNWLDSPEHDFDYRMYADNTNNAVYNTFFQKAFGILVLNCDGTVAMQGDWVQTFVPENFDALTAFGNSFTSCSIDWTPATTEDYDATLLDDQENSVGLSEMVENQLTIYPNPANEWVTFETTEGAVIEVRGLGGQLIEQLPAGRKQRMLNTSELANGVYVVVNTDQPLMKQKLVVMH